MRLFAVFFVMVGGIVLLAAIAGSLLLAFPQAVWADEAVAAIGGDPGVVQWGFAAAAASAGLSAVAAGYAVAHVGSAAIGAIDRKTGIDGSGAGDGGARRGYRHLRADRFHTDSQSAGLIWRKWRLLATN